jgi:hypothetical protein
MKNAAAIRVLPLLAAVVLSAGSATYSTRRAALTPEVAPPMRSGAPMDTKAALAVSLPTVLSAGDPTVTSEEPPGLVLPGFQVGAAGRLRVREHFDIGLAWEQASSNGARALAPDQPTVDGGDAYGYGVNFMATKQVGDDVNIAFIGELLNYSIPYVEYRTCVDNCEGSPLEEVNRGRTQIPVLTLGVVPNWRISRGVSLFGGVSARNQPTVDRGAIEVGDDNSSDVTAGDLNVMIEAGAEVSMGPNLKAMAMVYKNIGGTPLDYPATVAVSLSFGFGEVEKPAAFPPPAPPPPPVQLVQPTTERMPGAPEPEAPEAPGGN